MITINKGRHENFKDFKYFNELSKYPNLDIEGDVPKFFKLEDTKEKFIKWFDTRFNFERTEMDIIYGQFLGYPPTASYALFYQRKENENRIYVDYYGLMFCTTLSSLPTDISWVEEYYTFPENLKTWITIRHENPEIKESKTLVYSHSIEILNQFETSDTTKFSTNKYDIFKDWDLIQSFK
jgi:hypothetical protein